MESGKRTYKVERVKSTQKLPSLSVVLRESPLVRASKTAIPVAALTKFLNGKRQHLHQITQGRFTAVTLPVGVGHKTYGCIEGRMPRHIG